MADHFFFTVQFFIPSMQDTALGSVLSGSALCEPEFYRIIDIDSDDHDHKCDKQLVDAVLVDLLVHLASEGSS